jgi:hypothetical protein
MSIDIGLFTIVKSRGFDALKYEVIFDKWYEFWVFSWVVQVYICVI